MTSLLKLTALRQLNLTDSMELTQGRFAQLATLSSLHVLCLRDCFELKVCAALLGFTLNLLSHPVQAGRHWNTVVSQQIEFGLLPHAAQPFPPHVASTHHDDA